MISTKLAQWGSYFFCYILSSLFMHSVHETKKKTKMIFHCQCRHQRCTGPIGLLTPQSALNFTSCFEWEVIMQRNVNSFGMFHFTHKNLFLTMFMMMWDRWDDVKESWMRWAVGQTGNWLLTRERCGLNANDVLFNFVNFAVYLLFISQTVGFVIATVKVAYQNSPMLLSINPKLDIFLFIFISHDVTSSRFFFFFL